LESLIRNSIYLSLVSTIIGEGGEKLGLDGRENPDVFHHVTQNLITSQLTAELLPVVFG
jgi:hypothetical protein